MLVRLLGTSGVRADMITVFIDGFFQVCTSLKVVVTIDYITHTVNTMFTDKLVVVKLCL